MKIRVQRESGSIAKNSRMARASGPLTLDHAVSGGPTWRRSTESLSGGNCPQGTVSSPKSPGCPPDLGANVRLGGVPSGAGLITDFREHARWTRRPCQALRRFTRLRRPERGRWRQ